MKLPTRKEIIQKVKAQGLKVAAVLPIHYPRALLRAFGFHPVEVWGPPGMDEYVDSGHFPEYTCAIARNAASFLSGEGGKAADCILVPHTCDSLQGMSGILSGYLPTGRPVLTMYHPRAATPAAEAFLADELARLAGELRKLADVDPSDSDLHAAIDREAEADRAFNRICLNRRAYQVGDRAFYAALRSREYLPIEDFIAAKPLQGDAPDGLPVMISGIVPEPMTLFDHLADHGALVVGDDLACCGRRIYCTPDEPDPFRRMAKALLSKPPDPTTGHDVSQRIDHLVRRMEETGAKGMILYNLKFCEPELFFLPLQRKALEKRGWSSIYIEEDLPAGLSHQTRTRVEAFLEVLQ